MSAADTQPGTPENALRELELSASTQADRERIDLVRRWLAGWQRDCLAAVAREQRLYKAIARARKLLRGDDPDAAYQVLDWRQR